jgi:endonuclease/exonuclease/phosphatase family metal-dependent hydrolase
MALKFKCLLLFLLTVGIAHASPVIHVATWNIHHGKNLDRLAEEMRTTSLGESEILNLQEIMVKEGQAEKIANQFGYQYVSQGSNAILSKYPILASGSVLVNPDTGRRVVWADLSTHRGTTIRVYCPHLSYKVKMSPFIPEIRKTEMERLLAHAQDFQGPIIVAGDLNSVGYFLWGHENEPEIQLIKAKGYTDTLERVATRTNELVGRIDWIFTKGFKTAWAVKGDFAGSDHRWMQAWVDLDTEFY